MTQENQTSQCNGHSELSSQKGQEQRCVPKVRKNTLMQERESSEKQACIQGEHVRQRHVPKENAERRETIVRKKVKYTYLALIIFSLVIIVLFAFLLKTKLRAIKELPTEPSGQQHFEENPRITLPSPEDSDLYEEGFDEEEEADPSNNEEPNISDSSQP